MARLDVSGRVMDRDLTTALDWHTGDRLTLLVHDGVAVFHRDRAGLITLASRGQVPIPAPARQRLALHAGDRVLLAATPTADHLVIYPLSVLHHALTTAPHRGNRS